MKISSPQTGLPHTAKVNNFQSVKQKMNLSPSFGLTGIKSKSLADLSPTVINPIYKLIELKTGIGSEKLKSIAGEIPSKIQQQMDYIGNEMFQNYYNKHPEAQEKLNNLSKEIYNWLMRNPSIKSLPESDRYIEEQIKFGQDGFNAAKEKLFKTHQEIYTNTLIDGLKKDSDSYARSLGLKNPEEIKFFKGYIEYIPEKIINKFTYAMEGFTKKLLNSEQLEGFTNQIVKDLFSVYEKSLANPHGKPVDVLVNTEKYLNDHRNLDAFGEKFADDFLNNDMHQDEISKRLDEFLEALKANFIEYSKKHGVNINQFNP